jgi:hypothetical protein
MNNDQYPLTFRIKLKKECYSGKGDIYYITEDGISCKNHTRLLVRHYMEADKSVLLLILNKFKMDEIEELTIEYINI